MQTSLTPAPPTPPVPSSTPPRLRWFSATLIILFGVVLPALTLLIEALTHMCADAFFDPLPSVGHVFAIAAVPLANAVSAWALRRRETARIDAVIFAQAFAVAVSGVYALIFAPMTPVAVFAVMFVIGALPLAPLLSTIAGLRALVLLRRLRQAAGLPARRAILGGLAAGVLLLVALNIPSTLTRVMLVRAASADPAVSRSGIAWLRRIGQRDLMLRAAAGRGHAEFDVVAAALDVVAPIPPDKTREIYYRVTGRPIEAEPAPRLGRAPLQGRRDNRWDVNQGGDEVGVIAWRGLSLQSSRFDGSIDATAALGYLEWTFEVKNEAPIQREARVELALPPGGVVSRVTLWIDGVEREAAFAGRDATRRAYERVVRARRDPILVTTSAPDRVLIQCFPVAPSGGVMKARVGITAPLHLAPSRGATLGLPYLTQRNLEIPAGFKHAVWIASRAHFITPEEPLVRGGAAGAEEVRGDLPESSTGSPLASVTIERPAPATIAWAPERAGTDIRSGDAIIRQTIHAEKTRPPSRLIVVVDGGGAMKAAAPVLAQAARRLPDLAIPVAIVVASDDVVDLLGGVVPRVDAAGLEARLREIDFAGGVDSAPALAAAWDLAAAAPGSAVLWIHGPQSVLLDAGDRLRQRMERRENGPRIYAYAAIGGENRLLASLADLPRFEAVPRFTPGTDDLEDFLGTLDARGERIAVVRTRETAGRPGAVDGVETSDHLARLWAVDRIAALMHPASGAAPAAAPRKEALALAARYHLVTAVSGAVVLESQAETDAVAGSDAERASVPTVPEPETWALLGLVGAALIVAMRARRKISAGTIGAV